MGVRENERSTLYPSAQNQSSFTRIGIQVCGGGTDREFQLCLVTLYPPMNQLEPTQIYELLGYVMN